MMFTQLAVITGVVVSSVYAVPMALHLMENEVNNGAVCLDGTAAGFYFSAATNAANQNNWEIYFQGGGWCYDEMDCYGRSATALGSSKSWPATQSVGGIMDDNCATNPDFCNFNRVHISYCDGNSFSGDRTDPVIVNGVKLWFRGRRVLDAVLRSLMTLGLGNASQVLLTGCSAGGLSTYLHAEYVGDFVTANAPSLQKYKAASISGFFLMTSTVENIPVYPVQMQYIFNLANSTNGLNSKCIASKTPATQWECNFAQESYAHISYPIFALNSALDSWQTVCILTSEFVAGFPNQTTTARLQANGACGVAPGWNACAGNPESCTQTQIGAMNNFEVTFQTIMNSTATYWAPGNGAFVHSCHTHCEAQSAQYNTIKVNGVTMQQAVSKWWQANSPAPSNANNYLPCLYNAGATGPRQCNPTC